MRDVSFAGKQIAWMAVALLALLFLLFAGHRLLSARYRQRIKDLEAQRQKLIVAAPMLHKQKLDSLGTLAAGVAHEINNPISGILNYAQLLKRTVGHGESRVFVDEIEREAKVVAGIVRTLLHFGRADATSAIAVDVHDVVQNTLTLASTLLDKENITIRVQFDEDLPAIVCKPQQLQQVLMNLLMNARDALHRRAASRTDDKEIVIRVKQAGEHITFEIIDNGDGFDEATAERIFDPFFTTKPVGEGVGLGLSISHGIIEAHGGRLSCKSDPGLSTEFRVEIPFAPPVGLDEAAP